MTHKLEHKYRARVLQLEHLNPPAYRFLSRLEHEGPANGLRLSTSTHAHLYKDAAYLMRIELEGRGAEPTNLTLSPTPHLQIAHDAVDRADLLFPTSLRDLVMKHGGYKDGWARRGTEPELELRPSAPDSFFEALYDRLRGLIS